MDQLISVLVYGKGTPVMVRASGDILQSFPRNLSLPPFVESSPFICVCVDFHWRHDVCKDFFTQHNGTTCIPRWWFQTSFIFTPTWGNDPI